MIKCVIFDWDGTLVDTTPLWIETYKTLMKRYRVKANTPSILKYAYGNPNGCLHFGILDAETFNTELFSLVEQRYQDAKLFPTARSTIKHLKRKGLLLAVVSSTGRNLLTQHMLNTGLIGHFDLVVGRGDVKNLKPEPDGLLAVLNKFNIKPSESLFVGDTEKDLEAGEKAGITTILFNNKLANDTKHSHTINKIGGILEYIKTKPKLS